MREIERTYDNIESREWRRDLVETLSLLVYEHLRREGLLRGDCGGAEGDRGAAGRAGPPAGPGGGREEGR